MRARACARVRINITHMIEKHISMCIKCVLKENKADIFEHVVVVVVVVMFLTTIVMVMVMMVVVVVMMMMMMMVITIMTI